jgi:DNA-binding protein H-NS
MSSKKDSGPDKPRHRSGKEGRVDENLDELFDMDITDARVQSQNPPMGVPRYRDPENPFNTWSGKGRPPQWFRDRVDSGIAPEDMEIDDDGD